MSRLAALIALIFILAGCGGTTTRCPENDDPTSTCSGSHGQTYESR